MQLALVVALVSLAEGVNPFANNAKPYSQDFADNSNILKYTGPLGPWSQRRGQGLNRDPPANTEVDQVHMLHRHGERYPTESDATKMSQVYHNMTANHTGLFEGSLAFLNTWVPFVDADTPMVAQETLYGPYSGLFGALWNGVDYRRRYGHLYDGESIVPFFTSGYERVAQTARKFGEGFFGLNYTDVAALQIIPEVSGQGADTLFVGNCPAGIEHVTNCPVPSDEWADSYGFGWFYEEFHQAAERLNAENDGLQLKGSDIVPLMSTAAYELNVRGNSPWIDVFTDEEWIAYEYFQSSQYYCNFGPGGQATKLRGSLYLNATRTLLNQGPEVALPMYWSFAHDTDITPVVTLLGIANDTDYDPTKVTFGNKWDITDIVPQNARLVFERLVWTNDSSTPTIINSTLSNTYPMAFNYTGANATYANNYTYPMGSNQTTPRFYGNLTGNHTFSNESAPYEYEVDTSENIFVRVVLNEAVVVLPNCSSGPGKSCKLSEFNQLVDRVIEGVDYFDKCVKPHHPEAPQYVDFFWSWNVTNENDLNPAVVPYQVGLITYNGTRSNATEYAD